jgi:hypothetical protein
VEPPFPLLTHPQKLSRAGTSQGTTVEGLLPHCIESSCIVKIPGFLLAEFHQIVSPERRHMIEPEADLAAVGVGEVDKLTLACAIDEALLTEIPDTELSGWATVGDVVGSVAKRCPPASEPSSPGE